MLGATRMRPSGAPGRLGLACRLRLLLASCARSLRGAPGCSVCRRTSGASAPSPTWTSRATRCVAVPRCSRPVPARTVCLLVVVARPSSMSPWEAGGSAPRTALPPHPIPPAQLQALPPDIGRLRSLRTLHVVKNRLSSLPASLAGCSALVELHAGAWGGPHGVGSSGSILALYSAAVRGAGGLGCRGAVLGSGQAWRRVHPWMNLLDASGAGSARAAKTPLLQLLVARADSLPPAQATTACWRSRPRSRSAKSCGT